MLEVTEADLKRVAERYLAPEQGTAALITSASQREGLRPWIEAQDAAVHVL